MMKFIVAFDDLSFSEITMRYAISWAQQCKAHLVGIFLEDITRYIYKEAELTNFKEAGSDTLVQPLQRRDELERRESVNTFKQSCQDAGLEFSIHRNLGIAGSELIQESVYADLLIVSSIETMTRFKQPVPSYFLRELLSDVQCPVLLVPGVYKNIDTLVLLYDGEPASVFALRTFSYIFHPFLQYKTEVVTVKPKDSSLHLPDNKLIKEFVKRHYPMAEYMVLKGLAEEEIIKYLSQQKGTPLVVLGAYQRGWLSRMFRPSMADHLLRHLALPLFVAHNKT